MGGNILLHMATLEPERIGAMVAVSATMYFPEQARTIMRQIRAAAEQTPEAWEIMRKSHKLGDEQITALWDWTREMNYTPIFIQNQGFHIDCLWRSRSPVSR
jgi:pimeloyl-ACP methyl ester carboxylesterase